ncbi:MAG: ATP-dependent sacrificial sulfur transferase LarE, partial [Thermodesulfovibrionales bacterium]|nr:ATP-dependent sacrificial sulfur transferase LarE [Thermodesulfovibrionales bacterium]
EMDREGFRENSPERCFHCKDELFTLLTEIASDEGYYVALDGTNADDLKDHRPGMRAAKAHGVLSPLADSGMTKHMIREAAREAGLGISEKPASPCLSSRFSYGTRITPEGLERVSKAEDLLARLGLNEFRVRDIDGSARIEVPKDQMEFLFTKRDEIVAVFKGLGFRFVSLDLEGFESGKLNRVLSIDMAMDKKGKKNDNL